MLYPLGLAGKFLAYGFHFIDHVNNAIDVACGAFPGISMHRHGVLFILEM